jgi:paraquat-inducible protein B
LADVDLDDPDDIKRLVALGLRAELATESFVTGIRYVALDVKPDTPARLVHDPRYPEIPSLRSVTAEIPDKLNRALDRLGDIDIVRLAVSVQSTIDHLDRLLASPDVARALARVDQLTAHLDEAVRELRPTITMVKDTAASAGHAVAPAGRLASQIDATLREVQAAARSLRRLTDQISRDPGSILRGGPQ